jgi:hypothetical protein
VLGTFVNSRAYNGASGNQQAIAEFAAAACVAEFMNRM